VRRAMADLESRYAHADEMALDLDALLAAKDLSAFKPMQLPSMGGPAPTRDGGAASTAHDAQVSAPNPDWRTVSPLAPAGRETGPSTEAARDLGWRDMAEDPRQRRRQRRRRRAVAAALLTVLLATLSMHGLRFLLGEAPSGPSRAASSGPLEDPWLPTLRGVRAERGLLVLGGSMPAWVESELLGSLPDLRVLSEADLPPAGQADLRLALEVAQAQGADPATEEVRRALWEHAPIPVDLLLLEASDLDPEVLLPRLILGP
jgi:hypothetical protein